MHMYRVVEREEGREGRKVLSMLVVGRGYTACREGEEVPACREGEEVSSM